MIATTSASMCPLDILSKAAWKWQTKPHQHKQSKNSQDKQWSLHYSTRNIYLLLHALIANLNKIFSCCNYQMSKARCLDLATVRSAGTVRYQIHTKLTLEQNTNDTLISEKLMVWNMVSTHTYTLQAYLWCLNSCICGSWRNLIALCVQLKVMNERFHWHLHNTKAHT